MPQDLLAQPAPAPAPGPGTPAPAPRDLLAEAGTDTGRPPRDLLADAPGSSTASGPRDLLAQDSSTPPRDLLANDPSFSRTPMHSPGILGQIGEFARQVGHSPGQTLRNLGGSLLEGANQGTDEAARQMTSMPGAAVRALALGGQDLLSAADRLMGSPQEDRSEHYPGEQVPTDAQWQSRLNQQDEQNRALNDSVIAPPKTAAGQIVEGVGRASVDAIPAMVATDGLAVPGLIGKAVSAGIQRIGASGPAVAAASRIAGGVASSLAGIAQFNAQSQVPAAINQQDPTLVPKAAAAPFVDAAGVVHKIATGHAGDITGEEAVNTGVNAAMAVLGAFQGYRQYARDSQTFQEAKAATAQTAQEVARTAAPQVVQTVRDAHAAKAAAGDTFSKIIVDTIDAERAKTANASELPPGPAPGTPGTPGPGEGGEPSAPGPVRPPAAPRQTAPSASAGATDLLAPRTEPAAPEPVAPRVPRPAVDLLEHANPGLALASPQRDLPAPAPGSEPSDGSPPPASGMQKEGGATGEKLAGPSSPPASQTSETLRGNPPQSPEPRDLLAERADSTVAGSRPPGHAIESESPHAAPAAAEPVSPADKLPATPHQETSHPQISVDPTYQPPETTIKGDEIPGLTQTFNRGDFGNARKIVMNHVAQAGFGDKPVVNQQTGREVWIANTGIKHGISNRAKLDAFRAAAAIPQLIERAKYEGSAPDTHSSRIASVHTLNAPLNVDGRKYNARITVKEHDTGEHNLYQYNLQRTRPESGALDAVSIDLEPVDGGNKNASRGNEGLGVRDTGLLPTGGDDSSLPPSETRRNENPGEPHGSPTQENNHVPDEVPDEGTPSRNPSPPETDQRGSGEGPAAGESSAAPQPPADQHDSPSRHLDSPAQIPSGGGAGRIPVDRIKGGVAKPLKDMVLDLSDTLGRRIRRAKTGGASGGRALGSYFPGSARTVIRYSGDLDTAAHEAAHALDDKYGLGDGWGASAGPSPLDGELAKFWIHGSPSTQLPYKRAEGIAEYVRAWLVNPKAAEAAAPKFTTLFKAKVPAAVQAKLRSFGDDVRNWAGASGEARTLSNVDLKGPDHGVVATLKKAVESQGYEFTVTPLDRLHQNWVDELGPVWKGYQWAKNLTDMPEPRPSQDAKIRGHLFGGIADKIKDIFEHGMIDAQNRRRPGSKGIAHLLEPLDTRTGESLRRDIGGVIALAVNERIGEKAGQIDQQVATLKALDQRMRDLPALIVAEKDPIKRNGLIQELKDTRGEIAQVRSTLGYGGAIKNIDPWATHRKQRLAGTGGGIYGDDAQAQQTIAELKSDPARYARLQEGAARLRQWHVHLLDYMLQKGRISQASYDQIRDSNEFYVSFNRVMDGITPDARGGLGRTLGSVNQPIQRFHGSTREIEHPYASLMKQTAAMIREADRNEVLELYTRPLLENAGRKLNEGDVMHLAAVGSRARAGDADTVRIFRKGKEEHWQFAPQIHMALKGLGGPKDGDMLKYLSWLPSIQRWAITHSIPFLNRHFFRLTADRWVRSNVGGTPLDLFRRSTPEQHEQFRLAGGEQFGESMMGQADYHKAFRKTINAMAGDRSSIVATLGKISGAVDRMMGAPETLNRMAEYRRAYGVGLSRGMGEFDAQIYAAFQARGLMDYFIAGRWMRSVNKLVPFINADFQGRLRSFRDLRTKPGSFLFKTLLATLPMSLMAAAWNWSQGRDAEEESWSLPPYIRDMFWNFKSGPNTFLRIPKPYELGLPSSVGDRLISHVRGDKHAFEGFVTGKGESPIGRILSGDLAKLLISGDEAALMGPFSTFIQAHSNYDWFRDRYIIPPDQQGMDLQYRKGQEYASRIGQLIGRYAGIDARKVDFTVNNQLGGMGQMITAASDIGRADRDPMGVVKAASGLVVSSPGYVSRDAQFVMDEARRKGMEHSKDVQPLRDALEASYQATSNTQRDAAAREVRDVAAQLREKIEAGQLLLRPTQKPQTPDGPHEALWWASPSGKGGDDKAAATQARVERLIDNWNQAQIKQLQPTYKPMPPAVPKGMNQQQYDQFTRRVGETTMELLGAVQSLNVDNPTASDIKAIKNTISTATRRVKAEMTPAPGTAPAQPASTE